VQRRLFMSKREVIITDVSHCMAGFDLLLDDNVKCMHYLESICYPLAYEVTDWLDMIKSNQRKLRLMAMALHCTRDSCCHDLPSSLVIQATPSFDLDSQRPPVNPSHLSVEDEIITETKTQFDIPLAAKGKAKRRGRRKPKKNFSS